MGIVAFLLVASDLAEIIFDQMAKNAVAEGANWTQRVESEQNAALDWYKEWGTIYTKNSTAVTNLDDILNAKYDELKKVEAELAKINRELKEQAQVKLAEVKFGTTSHKLKSAFSST